MLDIWPYNLLFPLKSQDYYLCIKHYSVIFCMAVPTIAYLTNSLLPSSRLSPVFAVINSSEVNVYINDYFVGFLDPKVRKTLKLFLCTNCSPERLC